MKLFNPNQPKIEKRSGGRYLTGRAIVYYDGTAETEFECFRSNPDGTVDRFFERIAPGACELAPNNPPVVACWDHDQKFTVGRTDRGDCKLTPDEKGMLYDAGPLKRSNVAHLFVAQQFEAAAANGETIGSSFCFVPTEREWIEEPGKLIRSVTKMTLFDVCATPNPCYAATAASLRSMTGKRSNIEEFDEIWADYETWKLIQQFEKSK